MGHRLSKIVTRKATPGTTASGDGFARREGFRPHRGNRRGRRAQFDPRILLTEPLPASIVACLTSAQHDLFDLGGELSVPGYTGLTTVHVTRLEYASKPSTPISRH